MKKLMIAAAIVCAAAMAQAAATQWQDWSIGTKAFLMSDKSTKPNGQQVYLLNTGAENFSTLLTTLQNGSGDYANLAAVMASTLFTSTVVDDTMKTYASQTSQLVNQNYGQVKNGKAEVGSGEDQISSTYAVFVADGENYLISKAIDGLSYAEDPGDGSAATFTSTQFSVANAISGNHTDNAWGTYTASAVPEPTSGLLLLLGVAGLALRRRRA